MALGLVLLVAAAFLGHRRAGEDRPKRPALHAAVVFSPSVVEVPVPVNQAKRPPHLSRSTIQGSVKIHGTPPRRRRMKAASDPECAKMHPSGVLLDDIVVDAESNVRWAFVYVADGVQDVPQGFLTPLLLDQVGCRFEPHILGVRVNQPINIINNDPLLHTVHASTTVNEGFNFGLLEAGRYETRTFSEPEIMIPIRCDVHPWMRAWIGVLDHPYFCVTSESGAYAIRDLAPGSYLVKVWHELYATASRRIDVHPGVDVRLDLILEKRKD
jgi:hypothetical protein